MNGSKKAMRFRNLFLAALLVMAGCATAPRSTPLASLPPAPEGITHVVGTGDTLWRISKDYGVDVGELMRLNEIQSADQIDIGQTLRIPEKDAFLIPEPFYPTPVPLDRTITHRVGQHPGSDWRSITVHHSATKRGSARSFDRDHRRRRMGGLFYHFVIGNGNGSQDGEVEVGWRWRRQVEANRPSDIQICLVGDFNTQKVSEAQFRSLASLIHILRKQHNIPIHHIRRHRDIRGKFTECPGSRFPFYRLLSELRKIEP